MVSFTGSFFRSLMAGASVMALSLTIPMVAMAQSEPDDIPETAAALPAETLTIAVGSSEPGHLVLMDRIARQFNTRDGSGELAARAMISILPVEDSAAAMDAANAGRADLALSVLENLDEDPVYGDRLDDMWKRAVAVEVLTIVTRRTRMVRDPRQLNGLNVELAGDRVERITKHMNRVLEPHGIAMQGGSFLSGGSMSEEDAFLRLCQAEYDVRVDMVIHPFPAFGGDLPCAVRFMSFNDLDVPDTESLGVMRHIVPNQTYRWQRGNVVSVGAAVALIDPTGDADPTLRNGLADYLDELSSRDQSVLSAFDASLWIGENPEVD